MELTKITLTSGATYMVNHSPKEVYQRVAHSDEKPENHIHLFTLESGQDIYINTTYILSIETVSSYMTHDDHENHKKNTSGKVKDSERIKGNLEAVKEFKEDLDGNME
ncbi:hypothetical protein [Alkalibacterium sp. 20]|uniref:hypothetical protein n=1 Tax=Alkalibacterium sp. 20 TaxID=1798803 RepID=UPI0009000FB8|nr:hypothetical protein [Alkalibacterium sp. 20]OJF90939.1 hypothetical protein AX762_03980 [Alkalibacterium sp. 20]